jgi:diadenylate cyclase
MKEFFLSNMVTWQSLIFDWHTILEILILWLVIYQIALFIKGTKAAYLLRGIVLLLIAFVIFDLTGLFVLRLLLTKFLGIFLILIIVIFQPELREGLVRLGRGHLFSLGFPREEMEKNLREIIEAVAIMARKKTGALIAMERDTGLKTYSESGVQLNCNISAEIIQNIFYPLTPLHDGGVVVNADKIVAAACLFPLSDNPSLGKTMGTRHRAGLGLSENTDALVIIVSEENGIISLAINGQLTSDLTPNDLLVILKGQLNKGAE